MTLADILPRIMRRLIGKPRAMTPAGLSRQTQRLITELAERERRMDRLERVGLQRIAAENLYNKPRILED